MQHCFETDNPEQGNELSEVRFVERRREAFAEMQWTSLPSRSLDPANTFVLQFNMNIINATDSAMVIADHAVFETDWVWEDTAQDNSGKGQHNYIDFESQYDMPTKQKRIDCKEKEQSFMTFLQSDIKAFRSLIKVPEEK